MCDDLGNFLGGHIRNVMDTCIVVIFHVVEDEDAGSDHHKMAITRPPPCFLAVIFAENIDKETTIVFKQSCAMQVSRSRLGLGA